MIVVRLARPTDVDALVTLARKTGPGLTTLKPDSTAQADRLQRVQRTIQGTAAACEQGYLFVMEETASQRVVGVCGLEAAVGMEQPFYTYRVATAVHASRVLDTWTKMDKLHVSHDLTGYSELCTLFLDPAFRRDGNGALLSKSRLMFLAQFRGRFGEHVCAEMRGYFDKDEESPFWNALGAHFYGIDFHKADDLTALGQKSFLAELMPRHPVYVDFLPLQARECIGKTHVDTVPARRLLESEGLRFDKHIDIFEGGPVLEARIDTLRVMRESRLFQVCLSDSFADRDKILQRYLVANVGLQEFRVILAHANVVDDCIHLDAEQAETLRVDRGATVRAMSLSARSS